MSVESVAATFAALIVVGGGLHRLTKWIRHLAVRTDQQNKLLFGDDTEDYPGIRAFQERTDRQLAAMDLRTARMEAELFPNHGSSLRDAVNRIEKAVVKDTA